MYNYVFFARVFTYGKSSVSQFRMTTILFCLTYPFLEMDASITMEFPVNNIFWNKHIFMHTYYELFVPDLNLFRI